MARGLFITFEGPDGAGKSTLIRAVARQLQGLGTKSKRRILLTREPGGTRLAEKIRALVLEGKPGSVDHWTELFLYEASRSAHVRGLIEPALKRGDIVLCDRFTDSTLAYQGGARGLPEIAIRDLNNWATGNLRPHLTVLLDISARKGLAKAKVRNRLEAEGERFQSRVRKTFLRLAKNEPSRFLVLKAQTDSPEGLARAVLARLQQKRWVKA